MAHYAKQFSWLPNPLTREHVEEVVIELKGREHTRRSNQESDPSECASDPLLSAYAVTIGMSPQNIRFNRYTDIVPYDRYRVTLPKMVQVYLNASWVREKAGKKWTIATQAPLDTTSYFFLTMLRLTLQPPVEFATTTPKYPHGQRSRTVVQLTPNMEGRMSKAFRYFPKDIGQELIWTPPNGQSTSPLAVRLEQVNTYDHWICSVLRVYEQNTPEDFHLVRHLHFLNWPDHGVPDNIRSLLAFIKFVEACNVDSTHAEAKIYPDPPIIIGCSAGVGRTGTFIALSSLLRAHNLNRPDGKIPEGNPTEYELPKSPLGPLSQSISQDLVAQEVDYLREQRTMMVQSDQQLRFLYRVLVATLNLEESVRDG